MFSVLARRALYLIRVATPAGDVVEVDCNAYAERDRADLFALRVAMKLADPADCPLGLPEAVADVWDSLDALGADPPECVVQVVRRVVPSREAPHGWLVVKTERVAAYANLAPAAVAGSRR